MVPADGEYSHLENHLTCPSLRKGTSNGFLIDFVLQMNTQKGMSYFQDRSREC